MAIQKNKAAVVSSRFARNSEWRPIQKQGVGLDSAHQL